MGCQTVFVGSPEFLYVRSGRQEGKSKHQYSPVSQEQMVVSSSTSTEIVTVSWHIWHFLDE